MTRHEHMGCTFDRERIATIATEVQRRAKTRKDFLADRKEMSVVHADGALHLALKGHESLYPLRRESLLQMAGTLDLPVRFLDRLQDRGHTDIVVETMNKLLQREPKRHLVRTLDGEADALLSDRYRAFGNEDLLAVALQEIRAAGAEVWDLRLTRDNFRILAVAPHISGLVTTDRTFDPGDGWQSRWYGKEGDVLNAAITIENSETGRGGLHADPSIIRRICANFNVWGEGIARIHIGRKTVKKEDEVLWLKVRDTVKATFTPEVFASKIAEINETTTRVIEKPIAAVEATIKAYGLPAEYKEAIIGELLGSGDRTQYGLVQAVTAQVNPRNAKDASDETRCLFEDTGGAILRLSESGFKNLVSVG